MKKRGHFLFRIAAAAGFVLVLYGIISQQVEENNMLRQMEELESQVEAYSDRVDELAYDLTICHTEEYYLKVAREKLGYYQYGDTIFINDQKD
jgi:cell division protein FtsB